MQLEKKVQNDILVAEKESLLQRRKSHAKLIISPGFPRFDGPLNTFWRKRKRGQTHNPRVTPILIELILGPISVIGGNGQCIPHHILFDIDTKMIAAHMPIRKVCQMPNQIIL